MKRKIFFAITICFCYGLLFNIYAQTSGQQPRPSQSSQATSNPQKAAEEFIKKYFAISDQRMQRYGYKGTEDKPAPMSLLVDEALKVSEREGINVTEFFVSLGQFCEDTNVFWKDGEPQKEIVSGYAKRIPLVPANIYREWTKALDKACGRGQLQMMYNLGTITLLDRLFDSKGFREEEAKKFISRLRSIPWETTSKWADAHGIHSYQAAISLINIDSLFSEDVFQQEAFTKLVKK